MPEPKPKPTREELSKDEAIRIKLDNAGIGRHFFNSRLSSFGADGVEWAERVLRKDGKKLGLKKGMFVYASDRDFALTLAGAILAHGKSSVKHTTLMNLADLLDHRWDAGEDLDQLDSAGVACITSFYSEAYAKSGALPLRTRMRVQDWILNRMARNASFILQGDALTAEIEWWEPRFIKELNKRTTLVAL